MYMAPEVVAPDNHPYDAKSDIYSIGLVVYVMLTGLFPYLNWENRETLKKQVAEG